RLVSEADPLGHVTVYTYDAANQLVAKTDRDGRVTAYTYDDLGRRTTETWQGGNEMIQYGYNADGLLNSGSDGSRSLALTHGNRVKTVDNAGTPNAPLVVLANSYDLAGNVLSVADTINGAAGGQNSYSYDALNRMTEVTQTGAGVSDKRVDLTFNEIGQFAS